MPVHRRNDAENDINVLIERRTLSCILYFPIYRQSKR